MNMRAEHIQAILANPFYAITVAPQLVKEHALEMSDEQWVQTNARLMQDMGAEQWLAQALAFLQSGDVSRLSDPRMNPCRAVNIAPIVALAQEPTWSQEEWVQLNASSIREMGIAPWLMQLLDILEGDFPRDAQRVDASKQRAKGDNYSGWLLSEVSTPMAVYRI